MRVAVKPNILIWACQRAGHDVMSLLKSFPKLQAWQDGIEQPTLKQLEKFAKKVYVPLGMLFLEKPPKEQIPIPDFRTIDMTELKQPSPNLLETIYICQQRQAWYRDYMKRQSADILEYVGSTNLQANITETAAIISKLIKFDLQQRNKFNTWTDTLRFFKNQIEKQGILVMISGVVGSNSKRKLNPQEFRGFALVDKFAPLVFINASDSKSAQMFTLAHELAHIWLGESGISDTQAGKIPSKKIELWCNKVASELLVPLDDLKQHCQKSEPLKDMVERLARRYKVSTLVILRRIHDAGLINREMLWQNYEEELERLKKISLRSIDGGDFYQTLYSRVSKRFVSALVFSTLEGQTLFRDTFKMLGIKKSTTFYQIKEKLWTEL